MVCYRLKILTLHTFGKFLALFTINKYRLAHGKTNRNQIGNWKERTSKKILL